MNIGTASRYLRGVLEEFSGWMSNTFPTREYYRGLKTGHLIAIDKFPGVRYVIVGETWMRLVGM